MFIRGQPRRACVDVARPVATAWLLGLTLFGGALRFYALDRPPLWGDEAMTWTRICGSFGELIEVLRLDGFTPLHYELLWWIKDGMALPLPTGRTVRVVPGGIAPTPTMLRFVPALAGTLMVPAIYALAVQMASRRIALTAAAFAACSAYLLVYSRDAKMYMPAWLMVTLHVTCLLWWLRLRRERRYSRPAWYLWVAGGLAMVGLHATTAVVLGVELLIFASSRGADACLRRSSPARTIPDAIAFAVGVLIVLAALAGYYGVGGDDDWYHLPGFNRWNLIHSPPETHANSGLAGGGLSWVATYNAGRNMGEHVGYTFSAYLLGWEWPRPADQGRVDPFVLRLLKWTTITLFALVVLGLSMTPKGDGAQPPRGVGRGRRCFWLAAWIVLPTWACWLVSRGSESSLPSWWMCAAIAAALTGGVRAVLRSRSREVRAARALQSAWPVALVIALMLAVAWAARRSFGAETSSIWLPRYLGFVLPAFAVALMLILARLPTRPLRWGAVMLLLTANLAQYAARLYAGTEPPSDRIAQDLIAAKADPSMSVVLRMEPPRRGEGPVGLGAPGTGYPASFPTFYYAALHAGDTWTPTMVRGFQWPMMKYVGSLIGVTGRAPERLGEVVDAAGSRKGSVNSVVVWTSGNLDERANGSSMLEALGDGWRKESEETHVVREHWAWQRFDVITRRRFMHDARTEP